MSDAVDTKTTLQQTFDDLSKAKMALWDIIKDQKLYKSTDEWKQIEQIDQQLWSIKHQMEE